MSEYDLTETDSLRYWIDYGKESIKRRWQQGRVGRKSKELFLFNTTDIQYDFLPGPTWIRLLKLEAGSPGSVLRCSLRQVDLNQKPSYTALSYTWKQDPTLLGATYSIAKNTVKTFLRGESMKVEVPQDSGTLGRSKTIVCDGKNTMIFPNLYNALVQLRRSRPGEYWIDALCINQSNLEERASQVQLMDRIYQAAELVLVWLGTSLHAAQDGIPHLEYIADHDIDLPPMRSIFNGDKIIIPPGLNLNAKAFWGAYTSAFSIASSQWFRRVWVVQEFCWAKHVVFAMNETELSTKAVIKSLEFVQAFLRLTDDMSDSDDEKDSDDEVGWNTAMGSKYGPIWAPQIQYAPMTFQAREHFQHGGLWTLRQWLLACRCRSATDPRDLVFGGLSLIEPELLRIDPNLLLADSTLVGVVSKHLFTQRTYYPQVIPLQGTKNVIRPFREQGAGSAAVLTSLRPNDLWPALKADYTAGTVEVFMNTAACLLTHTGTEEILSLAARTSREDVYTAKWWISPGDKIAVEEIPSWAPTPGAWTSHVNEPLAFQTGPRYKAGLGAKDSPAMSNDGTSLFLDAMKFDHIDRFILDDVFIDDLEFGQLKDLLSNILGLSNADLGFNPIGVLSHVLLLSTERPFPRWDWDASLWLCHTLSSAVLSHLIHRRREQFWNGPRRHDYPERTNDDFVDWLHANHDRAWKGTDELIDIFEKVRTKYWGCQWPDWAEARAFDLALHSGFLRGLSQIEIEQHAEDSDPASMPQGDNNDRSVKDGEQTKRKNLLGPEFLPADPDSHARFTTAAKSALAWRKVFITSRGHIGLGPKWLNEGDTVMLVCGAPVPYAFTPLEVDLRRQERDIRAAMDDNDKAYNKKLQIIRSRKKKSMLRPIDAMIHGHNKGQMKRLEKEWLELQCKLDGVSNSMKPRGAWVLQGEVYIEGIMHGEAVREDAAERIVIV